MSRVEDWVCYKENFRFSLEPQLDHHFIHQDVWKYNAETKAQTLALIEMCERQGLDLRVFIEDGNRKLKKYAALYGFKPSYYDTAPATGKRVLILERDTDG